MNIGLDSGVASNISFDLWVFGRQVKEWYLDDACAEKTKKINAYAILHFTSATFSAVFEFCQEATFIDLEMHNIYDEINWDVL